MIRKKENCCTILTHSFCILYLIPEASRSHFHCLNELYDVKLRQCRKNERRYLVSEINISKIRAMATITTTTICDSKHGSEKQQCNKEFSTRTEVVVVGALWNVTCANMHASQARKLNWCCIGSRKKKNIVNEFEIHEITIKLIAHLRDKNNNNNNKTN